MIQDIYPSTLKNEYKAYPLREEDSVLQPNNLSLTNEMMRVFKEGLI